MPDAHLRPELFDFLFDLDVNNDRVWFDANRPRYEAHVREPVLGLIRDLKAPVARRVSRHLVVSDAKQGGSMFRIHRDVRFSSDKRPYKTNAAFQLRHEQGRTTHHAPGVYVHLEPGNCLFGAGVYRPDTATLTRIRDAIVERPAVFRRMRSTVEGQGLSWSDDRLQRGPRGYDPGDPLFDELCRTSWLLMRPFDEQAASSPGFDTQLVEWAVRSKPLLSWLCRTLDLPW